MAVSSAMEGLQESVSDDASAGQQMITRAQVGGILKTVTSLNLRFLK
jgi:hypothetical protein